MLTDKLGQPVAIDGWVVYPGRRGSRCWLNIAQVLEINEAKFIPEIKVRGVEKLLDGAWAWKRESITYSNKVLVVHPGRDFLDLLPSYKRDLTALQRLNRRAKKWGLVNWLKLVLTEKPAQNLALWGPQATGKTEFCEDLEHLGIVKRSGLEEKYVQYTGHVEVREYFCEPETESSWQVVKTRRVF